MDLHVSLEVGALIEAAIAYGTFVGRLLLRKQGVADKKGCPKCPCEALRKYSKYY